MCAVGPAPAIVSRKSLTSGVIPQYTCAASALYSASWAAAVQWRPCSVYAAADVAAEAAKSSRCVTPTPVAARYSGRCAAIACANSIENLFAAHRDRHDHCRRGTGKHSACRCGTRCLGSPLCGDQRRINKQHLFHLSSVLLFEIETNAPAKRSATSAANFDSNSTYFNQVS